MKPGLYVATVRGKEGVRCLLTDCPGTPWVCLTPVDGYFWWAESDITDVRPLVVLDPESESDCRRLLEAALDHSSAAIPTMQTLRNILRSLADPKPAEPTGLGAVVLDSAGRHWVRANSWNLPWVYQAGAVEPDEYIDERKWTDLDVAEVLSEGWSE